MATNSEIKEFIALFSRLAINECNRRIANNEPFVLPSVCMAQSALECDWGQAGIMKKANAFFGIKAGGSWTGKIYVADTWEVAPNGEQYNTVANFRAYDTPEESMRDYYNITCSLSRYSKAWSYGADKSKWLTAKETITAIWQGGYATDNLYVNKIMNTINGRDLTQFDTLIMGEGTPNIAYYSFTGKDLTQGGLQLSDGGRSFSIVDLPNAVALAWTNAFTVENTTTFTLTIPGGFEIRLARMIGDNVVTDETDYVNGNTVTITAGEMVAFYMNRLDLEDVSVAEVENAVISFNALPNGVGDEKTPSVIAFFVKIE